MATVPKKKKVPKNYVPVGRRMLCRKVTESKVSTLIHTPDSAQQRCNLFEVLDKGRDCVDDEIKKGSYVYTGQFAPMHLDFPGHDDWYHLNEVDVTGVVTEYDEIDVEIRGAA